MTVILVCTNDARTHHSTACLCDSHVTQLRIVTHVCESFNDTHTHTHTANKGLPCSKPCRMNRICVNVNIIAVFFFHVVIAAIIVIMTAIGAPFAIPRKFSCFFHRPSDDNTSDFFGRIFNTPLHQKPVRGEPAAAPRLCDGR